MNTKLNPPLTPSIKYNIILQMERGAFVVIGGGAAFQKLQASLLQLAKSVNNCGRNA